MTITQIFAMTGLLALLPHAQAATWAQLEDDARRNAISVQASRADRAAAVARRGAVSSDGGARIFASAGLADVREPVTQNLVRNYDRTQATVGIRWPLLASRLSAQRDATTAEWDVVRAQLREDVAGNEAVRRLRQEAVRAAHARRRIALSTALLRERGPVESELRTRVAAATLLAAEAMDLRTLTAAAQTQQTSAARALENAEQAMRLQAGSAGKGQPLPQTLPTWPASCFDRQHLSVLRSGSSLC